MSATKKAASSKVVTDQDQELNAAVETGRQEKMKTNPAAFAPLAPPVATQPVEPFDHVANICRSVRTTDPRGLAAIVAVSFLAGICQSAIILAVVIGTIGGLFFAASK